MRGNRSDTVSQAVGPPEKELERAKNAAYRYLSYRPRSRAEVEEKLREKDFDEAVISAVLDGLERIGYVNDLEFSRQWAAARIRFRGFGRRRIGQELRNKGVSRDIIRETLAQLFDDASENEIALREARKKLKGLIRFGPEVRRRRLAGHLERRGFPTEIIYDVLRQVREPII